MLLDSTTPLQKPEVLDKFLSLACQVPNLDPYLESKSLWIEPWGLVTMLHHHLAIRAMLNIQNFKTLNSPYLAPWEKKTFIDRLGWGIL